MKFFVVAIVTLLGLGACGGKKLASSPDAGSITDASSVDAMPLDRCEFLPEGPLWVVEGQVLTFDVSCATGLAAADIAVEDMPPGASYDSSTQRFTWTPGLDQAAVYSVRLVASSLNATSSLQIGVADANTHPENIPIADPKAYPMELGLPVLFLSEEPASNDAWTTTTVTYRGKTYQVEAKLRGKSSLDYPKRSYALEFDSLNPFTETEFADFSNRTRVILTTTFDDNSYVRQRLAYKLWSRLEPTVTVEAFHAVVYHGTTYWGLYLVSDQINAARMQRSGLSSRGNLYKAETHDANFTLIDNDGDPKTELWQGYSKVEGKPKEGEPGAFADLEELVSFVATATTEEFNAEIENRVHVDDYVAWWLLATFSVAEDSAGKNSYHYHDALRTWRAVPWDFNHSFGQDWQTLRIPADEENLHFRRNELFRRFSEHPTIWPAMILRFRESLQSGAFAKSALEELLDQYVEEIQLCADRDWAKWEANYRSYDSWSWRDDFTTFVEEVAYLRSWLMARWQFSYDTYTEP